jgi:hypothetical protein
MFCELWQLLKYIAFWRPQLSPDMIRVTKREGWDGYDTWQEGEKISAQKDLAEKRDSFQNLDVDGWIILEWLVEGWNSKN